MATHPLPMSGPVEISRSVARFTDFSGEMQLEYVGQLPPDNGHETANAWVYRVKNAEEYSVLNRSNHDFPCHIRYLTIQQRGPRYIRLGALDLADWRDYHPTGHGLCFGESRMLHDITSSPGS